VDIETIISVLGLLGIGGIIGGIIGSYIQHILSQRRETEKRIQSLNVKHYESTLVFMRIVLNPKAIDQFNVKREDPLLSKLDNLNDVRFYARKRLIEFYYSSLLFSPDEVLSVMKEFIDNPTEDNFIKSANAMRKDLWKKKTKMEFRSLSLKQKTEM
jgi:hypothetical protein